MNQVKQYRSFIKEVFDRYSPIEEATLSKILDLAQLKELQKGERLLDIGNVSKNIYILHKGIVVAYFLSKDGNKYHKNIFLEGDFVASTVSALTNTPSNFVLKTIEDATLISMNYEKYRSLIANNIDLKNFYIAYLEKNWVLDKEKREIELVMQESTVRYLNFIQSHPNIEKRVPLNYIASHLGITPTQLSRIRKKIKKNSSTQHR